MGEEEEREGGGGGVREFGREGTDCSIISAQTPLGFRVRDSIEWWRDKSLLLTFERIATYSNNPPRGEVELPVILGFSLSLQKSTLPTHC